MMMKNTSMPNLWLLCPPVIWIHCYLTIWICMRKRKKRKKRSRPKRLKLKKVKKSRRWNLEKQNQAIKRKRNPVSLHPQVRMLQSTPKGLVRLIVYQQMLIIHVNANLLLLRTIRKISKRWNKQNLRNLTHIWISHNWDSGKCNGQKIKRRIDQGFDHERTWLYWGSANWKPI